MTTFRFPLRVAQDGTVSYPEKFSRGLPVQGAAETLTNAQRAELEQELAHLATLRKGMGRPGKNDDLDTVNGPRPRTQGYRTLDGRPLPTSKDVREDS